MALKLEWPAAWISRMIGRTLAANCAACAFRAAHALHGAGGIGRTQTLSARLSGA